MPEIKAFVAISWNYKTWLDRNSTFMEFFLWKITNFYVINQELLFCTFLLNIRSNKTHPLVKKILHYTKCRTCIGFWHIISLWIFHMNMEQITDKAKCFCLSLYFFSFAENLQKDKELMSVSSLYLLIFWCEDCQNFQEIYVKFVSHKVT